MVDGTADGRILGITDGMDDGWFDGISEGKDSESIMISITVP